MFSIVARITYTHLFICLKTQRKGFFSLATGIWHFLVWVFILQFKLLIWKIEVKTNDMVIFSVSIADTQWYYIASEQFKSHFMQHNGYELPNHLYLINLWWLLFRRHLSALNLCKQICGLQRRVIIINFTYLIRKEAFSLLAKLYLVVKHIYLWLSSIWIKNKFEWPFYKFEDKCDIPTTN